MWTVVQLLCRPESIPGAILAIARRGGLESFAFLVAISRASFLAEPHPLQGSLDAKPISSSPRWPEASCDSWHIFQRYIWLIVIDAFTPQALLYISSNWRGSLTFRMITDVCNTLTWRPNPILGEKQTQVLPDGSHLVLGASWMINQALECPEAWCLTPESCITTQNTSQFFNEFDKSIMSIHVIIWSHVWKCLPWPGTSLWHRRQTPGSDKFQLQGSAFAAGRSMSRFVQNKLTSLVPVSASAPPIHHFKVGGDAPTKREPWRTGTSKNGLWEKCSRVSTSMSHGTAAVSVFLSWVFPIDVCFNLNW